MAIFKFFKKKLVFFVLSFMLIFGINNFMLSFSVFAWKPATGKSTETNAETNESESLQTLVDRLNKFVQFFSWFWIIPATIAWKLMTNWWVYGSNIYLDKYLWQLWQMIRNFANFFLAFLFIWMILYSFFKWSPWDTVKNYLPKILIATVLVQISWFLMWALVDVSNVLVAAVWSFPANFLKSSNLKLKVTEKNVVLDFTKPYWNLFEVVNNNNWTEEKALEEVLPKYDSVSWPLIYFGASALDIFNNFSSNSKNQIIAHNILVSLLLKFILIFMFILPLLVLAIVNFIRVFWIWIFIIFSPFVIIDTVFKWMISNKVWWFKNLTLSNLLWLIFMPVAVVWILGISLIFVVTMEKILTTDENNAKDLWFVKLTDKDSALLIWKNWEKIIIDDSIFPDNSKVKDYIWWAIWYIIMFLFVVLVLWTLIPLGFQASKLTAWVSDAIFKFAKDMAKAIPIPWTGGLSVWALQNIEWKMKTDIFRKWTSKQAAPLEDEVYSWFGLNDSKLTSSEIVKFEEAIQEWISWDTLVKKFFSTFRDISQHKSSDWTLNSDPDFKSILEKFLLKLYHSSNGKEYLNKLWLSHLFDKDWKLKSDWYTDRRLWLLLELAKEHKGDEFVRLFSQYSNQVWKPANVVSLGQKRK
jgi:hypothetical protein